MSDTDTPIMPTPHALIRDDQGFAVMRPVLTTLSVHGVATDHNARHLVVREGNVEHFRFRLGREDCQHLVMLLTGRAEISVAEQISELSTRLRERDIDIGSALIEAGINRSTWTRWQAGKTQPRLETWLAVQAAVERILTDTPVFDRSSGAAA